MLSSKGNKIANQFIITDDKAAPQIKTFQSYESIIATIEIFDYDTKRIFLDETYWDYSVTTSKYRNLFLNETKKETQAKIASGEYILTDLNG